MSRSKNTAVYWFASAALILPAIGAPAAFAQRPNPQVIKRFDTDGDGQLDEAERAAARKAMVEKLGGQEEVLKRFDANGDGKIDEAERTQIRQQLAKRGQLAPKAAGKRPALGNRPAAMADRAAMFRRFDENGDGKLDDAERAKLMAAMAAMRRGAGGGKPRPNAKQAKPLEGKRPTGLDQLPPEIQQRLMQRFDANKNGKLDPNELQKIREQRERMGGARPGANNFGLTGGAPPKPTLDQTLLLERFDANGNKRLDPNELSAAVRGLP